MKRQIEIVARFSVCFPIELEDWELDKLERGVCSLEEVLMARSGQDRAYELVTTTPRADLEISYDWNFDPAVPMNRLTWNKPKEAGDDKDKSNDKAADRDP